MFATRAFAKACSSAISSRFSATCTASAAGWSPTQLGRFMSGSASDSDGLEDLPHYNELVWSQLSEPNTVSIISAPMQYGQGLDGTDTAPGVLREAGLAKKIANLGWRVRDRGDVKMPRPSRNDPVAAGRMRHAYSVGLGNMAIANAVKESATEGHFSLIVGGDHSIAIGSISGALQVRPNLGVLWVDAHADINPPEESASGNTHGMPVAFLTRLADVAKLAGYDWIDDVPVLHPEQIVYVGLRDVDNAEKKLIRQLGIKAFTMSHVDKYGIGETMDMAISWLTSNGPRPLHMSFDIDGCDPSIAPSTGTAVPGGLNYREAHYIAEAMANTGLLCGMDMVEVNPTIGTPQEAARTTRLASDLIASALGASIL